MEARDFVVDLIGAGMTQSQIAERIGVQQATISKIARGDVRDVMSRSYRKLADLHAERMEAGREQRAQAEQRVA